MSDGVTPERGPSKAPQIIGAIAAAFVVLVGAIVVLGIIGGSGEGTAAKADPAVTTTPATSSPKPTPSRTTAVEYPKPWKPKGYDLYSSGVAYRFVKNPSCPAYTSCWQMQVVTEREMRHALRRVECREFGRRGRRIDERHR